jgi:hypothetical protein
MPAYPFVLRLFLFLVSTKQSTNGDQDAGSPAQASSAKSLEARKGSPEEAFKRSLSQQEDAPRTELELRSKFGSAKLKSAGDAAVTVSSIGMIGGLQWCQLSRPQMQPNTAVSTFGAQSLVLIAAGMYFCHHWVSKHRP